MASGSQSQENGDFWACSVFGWDGLWPGRLTSGPLASADPAVYPGLVGHLGGGKEEGPSSGPGVRSSHEQSRREDEFLLSPRPGRPGPALGDPCALLLADTLPHFPSGPSLPTPTLNSMRSLYLSSRLFIHGEEGALRKESPKAAPLEAGHWAAQGLEIKSQVKSLLGFGLARSKYSYGQHTGGVSPWDSFFPLPFQKKFLRLMFLIGVQRLTRSCEGSFPSQSSSSS